MTIMLPSSARRMSLGRYGQLENQIKQKLNGYF